MTAFKSSQRKKLSPTTKRIVRSTTNIALKGIEGTAKWMAKDHAGTVDYCVRRSSIMATQQSFNFSLARMSLGNRRARRLLDQYDQLVQTGKQDSMSERIYGWAVDHLLFLLNVLLGFIGPIVRLILWSIFRLVVILMCNAIFFYALYLGGFKNQPQQLMFGSGFSEFHIEQEFAVNLNR